MGTFPALNKKCYLPVCLTIIFVLLIFWILIENQIVKNVSFVITSKTKGKSVKKPSSTTAYVIVSGAHITGAT